MTCDTTSLEWEMVIDISGLTVYELEEILQSLEEGMDYAEVGHDLKHDRIVLEVENGFLTLYLNRIYDCDMGWILETLTEYDVRIEQMSHDRFVVKYDLYGPRLLDIYKHALKECDHDTDMVWDAWKEESGFKKYVFETYENEED